MRRHYGQTRAQQQADWLARFSDALITREARYSGRIDWDTAKHYYHSGVPLDDAVDRYCRSHPAEGQA